VVFDVTLLCMKTAELSLLSSRICPRDRRLPEGICRNTHANLTVEEMCGRWISLLSMDFIVCLNLVAGASARGIFSGEILTFCHNFM